MQRFQKRNPQLRVFNAVIHLDEETPHVHLDFVPFVTGQKRGLSTRNSLTGALEQQGFKGEGKMNTCSKLWVDSEKQTLAEIMSGYGIEWEQLGTHEQHLDVLDYKKKMRVREVAVLKNKVECTHHLLENTQTILNDADSTLKRLDSEFAEKSEAVEKLDSELAGKSFELAEVTEKLTVNQQIEDNKKFIIIGNQNAITYKEIFPLIKDNKLWLGYGFNRNCAHFINKHYQDIATDADHREGMIRVSGVMWYTNFDIDKRHEEIILYKQYSSEEFPEYDNYRAIEVSKSADIPIDYEGAMGVPITFMQHYNPDQFEIIGATESEGKGFSNGLWIEESKVAQPLINGERKYKRIFIKKRG